jgi:NIPSNAP
MNRRHFVRSALVSGAALGNLPVLTTAGSNRGKTQQWYELRTWLFANDSQRQLTDAYLQQALVPALNRAGIDNVGVFSDLQPQGTASLFLLIPYPTPEALPATAEKLARDTAYASAGAPYLNAPPANPAYDRMESSLLRAFAHMPTMEPPEKKERLFELRRYESPSESAGQKKIDMFNNAGEIDIFKKVGARPVFFGETMIGGRQPNLTYMLCFDNMEAHDTHWKAFGSDPDWKRISVLPEYSDALLISKIVRTFLTPTSYSQV